jgi:predicted nuclease of predicted toxin-antitoxin system
MQLNDYIYWVDANLPPKSAIWLHHAFGVKATHVSQIDFLTTTDDEIFQKAVGLKDNIIIVTKDEDFVELVLRKKSPPKIVWITAGNLSNDHLKRILLENLPEAIAKLSNPEYYFVEIG